MNFERPLIAIEAEHGVLGALMHKPELCEEIGAFLAPADFSQEDHAALYAMILAAHSKAQRPDSITLSDIRPELPSGEMTIVYASEIMSNVPSAANGPHYARTVLERARARKLYEAGQRLMELATQRGSIPEQVAAAQGLVFELSAQSERPDVVSLKDALMPVVDEMDARFNGKVDIGLAFGLPDLDQIIRGLRPGNLAVIAGRPGTGKTVLGVGLADQIAVRKGGSALIFSLEMGQAELAKRSLSAMSGVSQGLIESGAALKDPAAIAAITAAVDRMSRADVRICDREALTFARICSIARFQHRAKPLDVIVIDYLGLIASDPSGRHQNRNQELGAISRGLKALAKELQIPIVALAQLNRSIETRGDAKPKMSDLRDSGEIEQDADMIIMAHRDAQSERGQNGITEIDVVKCRHAKPGFCLLQFQGDLARFVSCAQQQEDDYPQQSQPASRNLRSMMGRG
ncbi:damage-inducible protein [Stutzerimonas degradans]|nr:damage-inducible protein [Stutzerimonas degradans]